MKEVNQFNQQERSVFRLFYDVEPQTIEIINTSHGDDDFREVIIAGAADGKKYIIKLADNEFTFSDRIEVWKKTIEQYCSLGYFCPKISYDKTGNFPMVSYKGHNCVAYAEDYSIYRSADECNLSEEAVKKCEKEKWIMTAKIAAEYLNYTEYPSGYCLFETFAPSDKVDEVLENAQAWWDYTKTLPEEFQEQAERIWKFWNQNRELLEALYQQLPTSVFQADLNSTNLLLDEEENFVGVYDFNLCGREEILNYLMRETLHGDFEAELNLIFETLEIVREYYTFSELEKKVAPMLYRCIKPLWYYRVEDLKELKDDKTAIHAFLDKTEQYLTATIDFSFHM